MVGHNFGLPDSFRVELEKALSGRVVARMESPNWNYPGKYSGGEWRIYTGAEGHEKLAAIFTLCGMIGCCGIAVSTQAYVYEPYRNKGVGKILNRLRQKMAKDLGYSILLCTDVEQNTFQRRLLTSLGWRDIFHFRNRRTNNWVYISVKELE